MTATIQDFPLETIDLSDVQFGQSVPYDAFAALRARAPIWWYEPEQCWVVTSYELVGEINRDFARFSSGIGPMKPGDPIYAEVPVMLADDPPVQTMYRRLVRGGWTPNAILGRTSLVEDTVRDVVGAFVANGGGDFVDDVAAQIAMRVVSTMVGVPASDGPMLLAWSNAMMPGQTVGDPDYRPDPQAGPRARAAILEYFEHVLAEHRKQPGDDLASNLLQLRKEDGSALDPRELRDFMLMFITGGNDTTRHLLSQSILAFTENPGERERLVAGEVTVASAVEEMLRWTTPVLQHSRRATQDVQIGGQLIQEGQRVTLWMISANNDETVFQAPRVMDLGRLPNPHTSFGSGGPHFCLGVHLARLEAVVSFEAFRAFLPNLRLAGTPERVWTNFFNALKRLPVALG